MLDDDVRAITGALGPDLYLPLIEPVLPGFADRERQKLSLLVRLRRGQTTAQAASALAAHGRWLEQAYPTENVDLSTRIYLFPTAGPPPFVTGGPMLERTLVFALTLTMAGAWSSPEAPAAPFTQGHSAWQRTDSQHFEIHYLPALARDLERVTRSAERAYDRISGRLNFTLPTKVPLVMFEPSGALTREQVVVYSVSDDVAPQHPHRSRIVLLLREDDTQLDALMVHELTHLLVGEIILPQAPGDGGVPRWVHEGIASHMADGWSDDHERLMRALVAAGNVPALSQLTGSGGFTNPRVNEALGHAAFDYIQGRWGPSSIRLFINALIVPRVDKTYDAVFDLTPAEFDAAYRQYATRRFGPPIR